MSERDPQRYRSFGDGLALAFELTVTPAIFGFLGHVVDGRLGTAPLMLLVLALLALAGTSVRIYYGYEAEMRRHEAAMPGHAMGGQGARQLGTG